MNLPLFLHSVPTEKESPRVQLSPGDWHVETNKKDSKLKLFLDNIFHGEIEHGHSFSLAAPAVSHAEISSKGSESALSLYLHKR